MTNLGIAGAVSLGSINQWISVINTNLTNSKKIGYKETKLSFTSGQVSSTGTTQSVGKIVDVTFPSASLEVAKTQILDYVQGNITPTGNITDFALNGQGYFVVEDKFGEKYATRDGQFNFDTDGYLVTLEGLRVLTSGLDYVRVPASERFAVNSQGESQVLSNDPLTLNPTFNPAANVSTLSQSVYGMKRLLVIDIVPETKLLYSKYGLTKFQLGTRVPIKIQNDFSEVTDGINTALIPNSLVDAGFAPGSVPARKMADYFKHDIQNGTLKMSPHDIGGNTDRYVQAAITGQQIGDFNLGLDFHVRDGSIQSTTNETPFGITFGKVSHGSTDLDSYFVGLRGSNLELRKNGSAVPITQIGFVDGSADAYTALTLNPVNKFTFKVDLVGGVLNAQIFRNGVALSSILTANIGNIDGYMSIGNTVFGLGGVSGSAPDNVIDITNLSLVERNKDSEYVVGIIQKNVKDIEKNGINDKVDNETVVIQQSVEESTATLAEALPQLSLAQKMFSAVSKIISVYNTMTDDVNGILR